MTDECSLRKAEKSIHIQTPHGRGKELGLPGTAIPLGPDNKCKAVSQERHTSKTPPVGASSALGILHTLPHHSISCLQRRGLQTHLMYRHMGSLAVSTALFATAGLIPNSGSTHGGRYQVQTGWIVFVPGSP